MAKTLEQYRQEARILREAKANMKKERRRLRKQKIDKNIDKVTKKVGGLFKRLEPKNGVGSRKKFSKRTSSYFINQARPLNQRQGSNKRRVKESPGRPRGDYKHKDPQTGQPIPATLYYKRVKEMKRLAMQNATAEDFQKIQELARRGIPPVQAKQIIDAQQLRSVGVQPQYPQAQQMNPEMQRRILIQQMMQRQVQQNPYNRQVNIPQGMPVRPQQPTIWRGRRGVVGKEAGLFGPRQVVFGLPESFWN